MWMDGNHLPRSLTDETHCPLSEAQGYGGGSYCVWNGIVYFVNGEDQQIYEKRLGQVAVAITKPGVHTYGDLIYDSYRNKIICIREERGESVDERLTRIVAVSIFPGEAELVVAEGADFYSSPRLSPCGRYMAWIKWDFPAMPWNESCLEVAEICGEYAEINVIREISTSGVSIIEPLWSGNGMLLYLDDTSGWWNPWVYQFWSDPCLLIQEEVEFGFPPYMLGGTTYAIGNLVGGRRLMLAAVWNGGKLELMAFDVDNGVIEKLCLPFEEVRYLQFSQGYFWFIGVAADAPPQIIRLDPENYSWISIHSMSPKPNFNVHKAQSIFYASRDGLRIQANLYVPPSIKNNARYPLIVNVHGGPTGVATCAFNPTTQFWVNSGYVYLDVNYRGSTGFGRQYREALNGDWGVAEVADCISAVNVVKKMLPIDSKKTFIRGNSAGGFTALQALIGRQCFVAASCYYGVTDLTRLCTHTHKFESQYTYSLIGSYSMFRHRYIERSPISSVKQISVPVLFLQGALDKIVDRMQTRRLFAAMRLAGSDADYCEFVDEGHGFRHTRNLVDALEKERAFYGSRIAIAANISEFVDI